MSIDPLLYILLVGSQDIKSHSSNVVLYGESDIDIISLFLPILAYENSLDDDLEGTDSNTSAGEKKL